MKLPEPIYFVTYQSLFWQDFLQSHPLPDPDAFPERFITGIDVWIIQTFLRLKSRGHKVYLTSRLVPNQICVAHFDDIHLRHRPYRSYLVAVRPDREPIDICQLRIVQNPLMVQSPKDHYLPSWPQPGLLGRDHSRGPEIRRIGYVGRGYYLPADLKTPAFAKSLMQRNLELVCREDRWHDCRDLDVILALRQVSPIWAATKPAAKLTNAWLAGCPAIVTPDPAYKLLRQSDLDYLEAEDADGVLRALDRLKSDPAFYLAMVENGLRRGNEFYIPAITKAWEEYLAGPVAAGYQDWKNLTAMQKMGIFAKQIGSQYQAQRVFRNMLRQEEVGAVAVQA